MSIWLIITKRDEEPSHWGLGDEDGWLVRVIKGNQEPFNIGPDAITDAPLPVDDSIVLVWAATAVEHKREVKDYLERIKLERSIRVWIHFGSVPSGGLEAKQIRTRWRNGGWIELLDAEINDAVRPFSIGEKNQTRKWNVLFQETVPQCFGGTGTGSDRRILDSLEQAWEDATRFYFEHVVMRELLEELFPLYLDLKGYLSDEESAKEYAQAVLDSIRSGTEDLETGESGAADRLMRGSVLDRERHDLANRFNEVWASLGELKEAKNIRTAAGPFCEWFENMSEEFSKVIGATDSEVA